MKYLLFLTLLFSACSNSSKEAAKEILEDCGCGEICGCGPSCGCNDGCSCKSDKK